MRITYFVDAPPTLEEAQILLKGFVELVTLRDGAQVLCDEEGRLKGYEANEEANALWGDQAHGGFVGDVLHLSGKAVWT